MTVLARLWRAAGAARAAVVLRALWALARHPETPRAAKWVAFGVLAYALSPIDLIPDFIPVLGQLDELILVPLGIALAVRLTPPGLWQRLLREAEAAPAGRLPRVLWGAGLIIAVWVALVALAAWAFWRWLEPSA
jgi:uncharacterized membrane protein YkvA (DUF1232 family)